MARPIRATLDLSALVHNHARVKARVDGAKVWSVVKANAYGHGLLRVAETLAPHTDGLALVEFDGAVALRAAGIDLPILMLEGFYDANDLQKCAEHDLTTVVHCMAQVRTLVATKLVKPVSVFVKLNTGMNRLGFELDELPQALRLLKRGAGIRDISLMTHFADADNSAGIATPLSRMRDACKPHDLPVSMANSAAILRYPETHAQWVRPGIMLYGGSPFAESSADSFGLRPVMSLLSKLIAVRILKSGESVGYGSTFTATKSMRVGIVACGYGDGYPRHADTGTPVVVNGIRTRTLGRVSMDKICVDLEPVPRAEVGADVLLWGTDGKVTLAADEVARAAGTISYELFCALARRVPVEEIGG